METPNLPVIRALRPAWNKGRIVGQERPLKPKHAWAIRVRLELAENHRDLALFSLAIDSKLRGCDLVKMKVVDVMASGQIKERTSVLQSKTQKPVRFEISEGTRAALARWMREPLSCMFRLPERDALAQLNEAVKRHGQWHQGRLLFSPDIGDRAGLFAMRGLPPRLKAALFQPGVQCGEVRKVRHPLEHLVTGIPDILLDLPLLPARCRIAELRLIDIVVRHGEEAHVDLPLLAAADAINRCAHIVVNPPRRHTTEDPERVAVGIEQHLMRLQGVSSKKKGAAVRQLDMRHLQLGALAAQTAKSSLQSNWKASPGSKCSGTNVPRPVVCCSRRRSVRHRRAKAGNGETRPSADLCNRVSTMRSLSPSDQYRRRSPSAADRTSI